MKDRFLSSKEIADIVWGYMTKNNLSNNKMVEKMNIAMELNGLEPKVFNKDNFGQFILGEKTPNLKQLQALALVMGCTVGSLIDNKPDEDKLRGAIKQVIRILQKCLEN